MKKHHHEKTDPSDRIVKTLQSEIRYWAKLCMFVFLFMLVAANVAASQTIPPLYYDVISEKKSAVVSLLQKIKQDRNYEEILNSQKQIFGSTIEDEVESPHLKRKQLIIKLENALKKGQKGRDILYALSVLYDQEGNQKKAQEYLEQAKEIDPLAGK